MEHKYHFNNIKYGLEFETLIYDVKKSVFGMLMKPNYDYLLKKFDKYTLFNKTDPDDYLEELSASLNLYIAYKLNEYCIDKDKNEPREFCKLGSKIHNMYYFSYTTEYHGKSSLPLAFADLLAFPKAPTWTVTLDSSVKLKADDDVEASDVYQTISDSQSQSLQNYLTKFSKNYSSENNAYYKCNLIDFDHYEENNTITLQTQDKGQLIQYVEFTSPILRPTVHSKSYIQQILKQISRNGEFILFHNRTTSQHVHLSHNDDLRNPENLLKVCQAWLYFEYVFMNLVPWWRKNNDYCVMMHDVLLFDVDTRPDNKFLNLLTCTLDDIKNEIKNHPERFRKLQYKYQEPGSKDSYCSDEQFQQFLSDPLTAVIMCYQGNPKRHSSRYAAFNMMNLLPGNIGTIEIRIKHGSNDPEEIDMFVQLYSRFLIAALNSDNITQTVKDVIDENFDDESYLNDLDPVQIEELCEFLRTGVPKDESIDRLESSLQAYWEILRGVNDSHEFRNKSPSPKRQRTGGSSQARIPLFSYGSNHSKQLQKRIKSEITPRGYKAVLNNHVRIFAGYSRRWKGGVASIHPYKGKHVDGVVYYLTPNEISKLDSFEKGYKKVYKYVTVENQRMKCLVYVKEENKWHSKPSQKYLDAIQQTLIEGNHEGHIELWGLANSKLSLF